APHAMIPQTATAKPDTKHAKRTAKQTDPVLESTVTGKSADKTSEKKAKSRATAKAAEVDTLEVAAPSEPKKRGRKPKAAAGEAAEPAAKGAAAQKNASIDEDEMGALHADVEADLDVGEGDAEGGEADAGEDKPKAKPLRMKVSRAKERALMREFGIDDTALSEEEVNKRRQEL